MVKLIDLIFISIPEAFAMSYFIWIIVGRNMFIDHKKIAIASIVISTALNATFESIENVTIRVLYQVFILLVIYYLVFRYRMAETIVSCFTLLLIQYLSQSIVLFILNEVINVNMYFTEIGIPFKDFIIKFSLLVFESIVLFTSMLIARKLGFKMATYTKKQEHKDADLTRFIISILSMLLLLTPEFRLLGMQKYMFLSFIIYIIINTSLFTYGIYNISREYITLFINTERTNAIQKYQLEKSIELKNQHNELIENAHNVVEMNFVDKNNRKEK